MPPILVFIIGTSTGIALKYLWDHYKNYNDSQKSETIASSIKSTDNNCDIEYKKETGVFYLQSIVSIFNKYKVNINDTDAIGILCSKIRYNVQLDLLELLAQQASIKSLLHTYQSESVKPFQIAFDHFDSGVYIKENQINDKMRNLGFTSNSDLNIEQKVELILKTYYAKGIEIILKNFGWKFEKLEQLFTINDTSLEKYYNTLKDDLIFDLKLLKK